MAAVRVLSTKKLQPNQKQYLLNAGLAVIEADFIGISYKPFEIKIVTQNIIFTSQNAFKSFLLNDDAEGFKDSKIFCVGSKTKQFIEGKGYKVFASAEYAEYLAEVIITGHAGEDFIFFSGSMRRDTLPDALIKANVNYVEVEVYETVLTPQKISAHLDGILFYSLSGIESFLKKNTITNQTCFCIGTTTSAALNGLTENIVVANKPSIENVIVQCINYYKNMK
jgi:uroporphyrinogen-III synthase